jgi:hypothetical protein
MYTNAQKLTAILLLIATVCFASPESIRKYCLLTLNNYGVDRNFVAYVDTGQAKPEPITTAMGGIRYEGQKTRFLTARSLPNNTQRFFSPTGALNFMAAHGWHVVAAFDDEHYLLERLEDKESRYEDRLRSSVIWVATLSKNSPKERPALTEIASAKFRVSAGDIVTAFDKKPRPAFLAEILDEEKAKYADRLRSAVIWVATLSENSPDDRPAFIATAADKFNVKSADIEADLKKEASSPRKPSGKSEIVANYQDRLRSAVVWVVTSTKENPEKKLEFIEKASSKFNVESNDIESEMVKRPRPSYLLDIMEDEIYKDRLRSAVIWVLSLSRDNPKERGDFIRKASVKFSVRPGDIATKLREKTNSAN